MLVLMIQQERDTNYIAQLVHQFTGASLEHVLSQARCAYIGMDATAPSIHTGYLIPIILAKRLHELGVKIIVLLGGATTLVGDPTGKVSTRQMLDDAQLASNKAGLLRAINKFFPYAQIVDNISWFSELGFMDFLSNTARYISVSKLIKGEQFSNRLEQNQHLSLMELLYPTMQAYDFYHLYKEFDCNVQLGGSDQWHNIICGVELVRAKLQTGQVFGITNHLLTNADGVKMGKTEKGAIWLDPDLCTAYDFWHYWRNIDDESCKKYTKMLLSEEPIADINQAKIHLATELTAFVHDRDAANVAKTQAAALFVKDYTHLEAQYVSGDSKLFAIVAQLFNMSNSEAKALIQQGGIKIEHERVTDPYWTPTEAFIICKGGKEFAKCIVR